MTEQRFHFLAEFRLGSAETVQINPTLVGQFDAH
jgi:hypothetical protein